MAANVVKLTRKTHSRKEDNDVPIYDPIFFPKEAITLGIQLNNYGRRDPGSIWEVTRIQTYVRLPNGLFRLDRSPIVLHLHDLVHLQRQGDSDGTVPTRRVVSFGSLSYSAIWRLRA